MVQNLKWLKQRLFCIFEPNLALEAYRGHNLYGIAFFYATRLICLAFEAKLFFGS